MAHPRSSRTKKPAHKGKATPPHHVYTIPSYRSFMDSLAQGIVEDTKGDPLKLADYTVLVPNRAAGEALRSAFMDRLDGRPAVLPAIMSPGDLDSEELNLSLSGHKVLAEMLADMPPPVSRLHRQLVLAGEILKMPGMASSLRKAVTLAGELGHFIDEAQRNDVSLNDLDGLVPGEFKGQWARTAEFLKIVTETWPAWLEKNGLVDPEDHNNAVTRLQAAHWRENPPPGPVLAAGFSDASPAVLDLVTTVSDLPQGGVVLPGLDRQMNGKSWKAITPVHPQSGMKKILEAAHVQRGQVREWETKDAPQRSEVARENLLRRAMRPAGGVGAKAARIAESVRGLDVVVLDTPQEEANVIALKMREALERTGKSTTLVTEDRSLARRVSARLRYWGVSVGDSAGTALSDTPVGIYFLGTAQMAAEEMAPVPLLSALKTPLAALGEDGAEFRKALLQTEDRALHGPRPAPGMNGLKGAAAAAFARASRRPSPEDRAAAEEEKKTVTAWLDRLEAAGGDFLSKMAAKKPVPFGEMVDAHIRFAETLAADGKQTGAERLWRGESGVKAVRFLNELREAAHLLPPVTGRDYADLMQSLMREAVVHTPAERHPDLRIMTPEQAVFSSSDSYILGGLNADVWPRRASENPWLSRDMTKGLGLPAPEDSIGRSAHRFAQLAARENVLLTRAERSADAPAVASPFLTRLMMTLKEAGLDGEVGGAARLPEIVSAMHTPPAVIPVEPPAPTPPADKRPKELPVTAVETLMQDPYSVYARYILKLRGRAPVDAGPNQFERGTLIHDTLDAFVKKFPEKLPDNAYDELIGIGKETFAARMNSPTVQSFWWPRFERIAQWFVKFESERREMSETLGTEVHGKLDFDLGDGQTFRLTAIADRIDRNEDGQLEVIDYKTGSVPTQKSVALGFHSQLTLEAAIAFRGGMEGVDPAEIGSLQYWKLSGARPAATITEVKGDPRELSEQAVEGTANLIRAFNDPKTPYLPTPRAEWSFKTNFYRHLSREGEWSKVRKTGRKPRPQPGGGKDGPK